MGRGKGGIFGPADDARATAALPRLSHSPGAPLQCAAVCLWRQAPRGRALRTGTKVISGPKKLVNFPSTTSCATWAPICRAIGSTWETAPWLNKRGVWRRAAGQSQELGEITTTVVSVGKSHTGGRRAPHLDIPNTLHPLLALFACLAHPSTIIETMYANHNT